VAKTCMTASLEVRCIDFASNNDFLIGFFNCSECHECDIGFCFSFYLYVIILKII
jgi:hypothetical protein